MTPPICRCPAEALGYDHQDGQAKYLENAVVATKATVAAVIGESIRRVTA
ncbi:hypothetical protein GS421_06560 [Rhodococcus hoagii]|nr:hypothetical protein [Prescottella equi]